MRIGQGFDIHPMSDDPGRKLILGGVYFPGERALVGHSDSDVIAHALTDAILGAAGLGDIGELYPDTDAALHNADSMMILADALERVHGAGYRVVNADCTVICEVPKLAPRKSEIRDNLSRVLQAPCNIKGKRAEGLGALGRREGIACMAVALIRHNGEEFFGGSA